VVEPANAQSLHRRIGSNRKALIVLPHSDHLVALDRDRDRAIAATLDFVLGRGELFEEIEVS
jgi:esterase/lipase